MTRSADADYPPELSRSNPVMRERMRMEEVKTLFGAPFASTPSFWVTALIAVVGGAFLGLAGLGFFNAWQWGFDFWIGRSYKDKLDDGDWPMHSGEYWWTLWSVGGALAVWLMRQLPWFPDEVHGLFREVMDLNTEVAGAPLVLVASAISIACGASVGPEAALGTLGGAVGMILGGRRADVENRRGVSVLVCMAGAMGSLLPTPLLSVMMMHELFVVTHPGESWYGSGPVHPVRTSGGGSNASSESNFRAAHPYSRKDSLADVAGHYFLAEPDTPDSQVRKYHDWMEQVVLMGLAASAAYMVYFGLVEETYIHRTRISIALYDAEEAAELKHKLDPRADVDPDDFAYHNWYLPVAVPLGVIGGVLGLIICVWLGLAKKINDRIMMRLENLGVPTWLASLLLHLLVGGATGLIAKDLPLTLGDGFIQIKSIIQHGVAGYGVGHIWATMFAKIFLVGFCLGFGFIGGQIFPCMFVGACAGLLVTHYFPQLPWVLTVPSLMSAVPVAFAPIPFTMTLVVEYVLVIGPDFSAPVFVSTFTAWLTNCGIGMIQRIMERSQRVEDELDKKALSGLMPPTTQAQLEDPLLRSVGEQLGYADGFQDGDDRQEADEEI
eukprot:CAMPEP_0118880150 /NCGR_PEP_ID=MMETSP1163-20130328/19759_1 /TAXON_ID=124430 /ORGANISM="Phaeomonas parva, Strain CCMP2877" /LENGTH=608 /DNA_ID=CAMNT_0006816457 /DNA_START=172 /DNA_END=1998 /DNA_ORIENTATION=+